MNAALRHLSVRLWLTAITGGMAAIFVLPWWQQTLGLGWLMVPAGIMMGICFVAVGWLMNRIGLAFLKRHVNEAAVWERAGMMKESEANLGKAMATFDSFWLSPLGRSGKLQWFSAVMARFYLGHLSESPFARSLVSAHLRRFPEDASVAEMWLEQLLSREHHQPHEHETVVLVSHRLGKYQRIQRLLMQFYMINGRVDFDAMQTYRRVWYRQGPMPVETMVQLAGLLLNEYILNHWALEVYLKAHGAGHEPALEGIAAAVERLPVTEESRPHLKAAKDILEALGRMPAQKAHKGFQPQYPDTNRPEKKPSQGFRHKIHGAMASLSKLMIRQDGDKADDKPRFQLPGPVTVKRALPAAAIVLGLVLIVAGIQYYRQPGPEQPVTVGTEKMVEDEVLADPFTIQVAAYMKTDDAQRFVDRLIQNGLDAFWTQAASASRTWYQVKVSHFATRELAQRYGRELKSKGLIDDFYVANYDHDRRNVAKP